MAKTLSVDDIHQWRTNGGKVFESPETAATLDILIRRNPQQFNFGSCPSDIVAQGAGDAMPFIEHKVFNLPFDTAVLRVNEQLITGEESPVTIFATTEMGGMTEYDHNVDINGSNQPDENLLITQVFLQQDTLAAVTCFLNYKNVIHRDGGRGLMLGCPPSEEEFFILEHQLRGTLSRDKAKQAVENVMSAGVSTLIGLIGMLNTRHIPKTVVAPSRKLNAARVKSGKLPLPYVTTIDIQKVIAAHRNVLGGTGANKRPHWRRAHPRHLRSGKCIGVNSCYVNWEDGTPYPDRTEYEVTP